MLVVLQVIIEEQQSCKSNAAINMKLDVNSIEKKTLKHRRILDLDLPATLILGKKPSPFWWVWVAWFCPPSSSWPLNAASTAASSMVSALKQSAPRWSIVPVVIRWSVGLWVGLGHGWFRGWKTERHVVIRWSVGLGHGWKMKDGRVIISMIEEDQGFLVHH